MRSTLSTAALALAVFLTGTVSQAHEFWLSPERYQVPSGEAAQVTLRVGENLKGSSYIYNDRDFARFDMVVGADVVPVEGTLGDNPALDAVPPVADGLMIVVHETTDNRLTYKAWDKFVKFVEHKDFVGALDAHKARGLPDDGFRETYRRLAKSLIAVGSGAGEDRAVGLTTEIVALANPYTDDTSAGLPLLVLRDGAPRVDAQLELFEKAPDGTVEITLHRTDAEGRVTVQVKAGHEYLADAVMLDDTGNDDPEAGAVWHSLWASLTFRIPD